MRALVWSVGCLAGRPAWGWGSEPDALAERVMRLLLPSIVAGRAATGPARWAHRVTALTCHPTGAQLGPDDRVETTTDGRDVLLVAGGVRLATAQARLSRPATAQA
jgi:hypothetical protein